MSGFFEEVKRRKVYRVAVAYVVVAGGIIQLASAAFPAWEMPNWALRLVIVLLLLGFPIALIFAWVFDITPEGVRATAPVTVSGHRRRNIALLVGAGIIISAIAGFFLLPRISSAHKVDKSIAVLPFENLSDDKENAFFADGIQDDILTNLAHIGDLKVVSRTSVMGYRGKPSSVREIGKALGVSAILEGTVRKAGNRVRLNVQLINADNDEHIWAQEYDRDLNDVFAIQTDLAQKVANELQAKLSPSEKAQLTRKPTENNEAYLAFLQAHDLQSHLDDPSKLGQAEQLYKRAVELDPDFALAYAGYSRLQSWIHHTYDASVTHRDEARQNANRALQLQPDLPEGHLALGFSYYYGDTDYDAALREFEIAQKGLPNANEVYLALGAIQRRQARWAESNANLEKSASLNPKDVFALQNLALNYEMMRDWENARATIDRGLKIDPKSYTLWEIKAKIALESTGDFGVAEEALRIFDEMPASREREYLSCGARAAVRSLQRKYPEAIAAAEAAPDVTAMQKLEALPNKHMVMGIAYKGMKNETAAREAFTKAKESAQQRITALPSDPAGYAMLSFALACLGEKEAALANSQRAIELLPVSKDAFEGPGILENAAEVYTLVGENDRALQTLEELSRIPSPLSTEMLKLNPVWDGIRNDPRFQQLLPKFSGKI